MQLNEIPDESYSATWSNGRGKVEFFTLSDGSRLRYFTADTGAVRATVPLGGEVGNVVDDTSLDQMVVAVQGRDDLAVVDPSVSL